MLKNANVGKIFILGTGSTSYPPNHNLPTSVLNTTAGKRLALIIGATS